MGKLSVDAQTLRDCATRLVARATEVEDIFYNTKALHAQIAEVWDGDASQVYLDKLAAQKKELTDIDNVIHSYATALNSLARHLEEQDRQEEERIRLLQKLGLKKKDPDPPAPQASSGGGGGASFGQNTNLGASLGNLGGGLGKSNKKK